MTDFVIAAWSCGACRIRPFAWTLALQDQAWVTTAPLGNGEDYQGLDGDEEIDIAIEFHNAGFWSKEWDEGNRLNVAYVCRHLVAAGLWPDCTSTHAPGGL